MHVSSDTLVHVQIQHACFISLSVHVFIPRSLTHLNKQPRKHTSKKSPHTQTDYKPANQTERSESSSPLFNQRHVSLFSRAMKAVLPTTKNSNWIRFLNPLLLQVLIRWLCLFILIRKKQTKAKEAQQEALRCGEKGDGG